ncbi:MAG: ABC transporter permease [Verrucomicrobiota bacterium]|nr:ABC transporter permease [Verrucomicrobiota bacterium]
MEVNAKRSKLALRWKSIWRLRSQIPWQISLLLTCFSFLLVLLWYIWKSESAVGNVSQSTFFPTVSEIVDGAVTIFTDEDKKVWTDIGTSAMRVFTGFLLAAVIAIPLGIYMGSYRIWEAFMQPIFEFIRYFPVPALIPLLVAIYGVDEESKIILIFLGTFFQLILMVADEVRRVSEELVKVAYTMGANSIEVLFKVLLPSALPGIFDALRLCHGWAWTYVVVAEMIATNEGLGIRIMKFARFVQMPKVMTYLLILGMLGLILDLLFRYINQKLFHWSKK